MNLALLQKLIEKTINPACALVGDPIGLQLQSGLSEVNKILIAYEVTNDVVEEAIRKKVDLIIAFHPLIYSPLKEISENDRVGKLITKLIQSSIALYIVHTAFDCHNEGTSKVLADKLGLNVLGVLQKSDNDINCGIGVVAESSEELSLNQVLSKCKEIFKTSIRYNQTKKDKFKRFGILGGSGFTFIESAFRAECDVYITADCSYHKFHQVEDNILLVDAGHYETEQFVPEALYNALTLEIKEKCEVFISEVNTNPVLYY